MTLYHRTSGWFLSAASAILGATGLAKLLSGFGNARVLALADPIIGLQFRYLLLGVGLAEVFIALGCFYKWRNQLGLQLIAWFSTNLLIYRMALWWIGWHRPCPCLGNLTDALHVSPALADNVMKLALAYLMIGSYALLICRRKTAA